MTQKKINVIDPGNDRVLRATFEDALLGGKVDPDVVKLEVRHGDGTEVTYVFGSGDGVIVKDEAGEYSAKLGLDIEGKFYYRWYSEGAGKASLEHSIIVRDRKTF